MSESKGYSRCRLVGYPRHMRFPASAADLQEWHTWDARIYQQYEAAGKPDPRTIEVSQVTETLVFKLVSAFLTGSDYAGDTAVLQFEAYKYRMSHEQWSIQSMITKHLLCYYSSKKQEEACSTCRCC